MSNSTSYEEVQLIPCDENITQFIYIQNDETSIPSTSTGYLTIKQEPEISILPDNYVNVIPAVEEIPEVQEVVEEQAVYAYEITRNDKGELECPVCCANFKIIANLERHIQIHAKKFVFEIPKGNNAPKILDGPQKLPLYPCTICPEAFEFKRHLQRHIVDVHTQKYKCPKCTYKADSPAQLIEHQANKHLTENIEKGLWKCKECPAVMKTVKALKNHMTEHLNQSNQCEKEGCKKMFKTKSMLKLHERRCK